MRAARCIVCKHRDPRPGFKSCDLCAQKHRERQAKYEAKRGAQVIRPHDGGFCAECCATGFHRDGCREAA